MSPLSPLQVANEKRHIVSLIKKHGLTGAKRVLETEGKKFQLYALSKLAKEAGIEVPDGRGRPEGSGKWQGEAKDQVLDLIRQHGSHKVAREILKSKNLPCPSLLTMVRLAQEAGITVKRGRPKLVAAA